MNTIFYGICYYYGKNCKDNIKNHLINFLKISSNKKFIIFVTVDYKDLIIHDKVKKEIINYAKKICKDEIIVLTDYNWGGTIQGLWYSYNYINNLKLDNGYLAFFEEDFLPINDKWLEDSIELLEKKDYIYIGEHNPSIYKEENINNTKFCKDKNQGGFNFLNVLDKYSVKNLTWTDGGYYFSSLDKFLMVEKKIGIFHKGDKDSKYNHGLDGVILGEVGFPSQIACHFKFYGLLRKKYFIHS